MLPAGSGGRRVAKTNLADKLTGKVAIGLIFVTNHRRLADISDLQPDYAITVETHELDLVRWLAINPFFERHLPVRFANLLVGLANGLQHHLTVHADQNLVVQDSTFELGRERVGKGLDRSLEGKVDHRNDQFAYLGGSHLRDKFVEHECHPRADWNMAVILSQRRHSAHASHFDVLHDVVVLLRAVVELKEDAVRLHFELSDHYAIARLDRDTVLLQLLRIGASRRTEGSVGMEHDALGTERKRANRKGFICLEGTDKLLPCPLRDRSRRQLYGGRLDGGEICLFGSQLFALHSEDLCVA